ncbi:hypothetical protein HaLaN_06431, partial [Haematococcus lacustris]
PPQPSAREVAAEQELLARLYAHAPEMAALPQPLPPLLLEVSQLLPNTALEGGTDTFQAAAQQ